MQIGPMANASGRPIGNNGCVSIQQASRYRGICAIAHAIGRTAIGGCWLLSSLFARDAIGAVYAWTGLSIAGAQWSQPSNWNPTGPPPAGSDS